MPLDPIRPSTPTTTDQSSVSVTNDTDKAPDQLEQQEPVKGRAFSRSVKSQTLESEGKKFVSAFKRQAEGHSGPPVSIGKRLAKGWDSFKGIFTRNKDSYTLAQPKETGHKKEAKEAQQRATRIANEVATAVSSQKPTNVETVKPRGTRPEPPPKPAWLSEKVKPSQPQRHHSAPAGITPQPEATQKSILKKTTSNPPDHPAPQPPTPEAKETRKVNFSDELEFVEPPEPFDTEPQVEEDKVYDTIPENFVPRAEREQIAKFTREITEARQTLNELKVKLKAKHTAWRVRFAINRLQKKHAKLQRKGASLEQQADFLKQQVDKLLNKHSRRIDRAGIKLDSGISFKQRSITEGTLTTHSPAPTIPAPPPPPDFSDVIYDKPVRPLPSNTPIYQRLVQETMVRPEDSPYEQMKPVGSVLRKQSSEERTYENPSTLDDLNQNPEKFSDYNPSTDYANRDALQLDIDKQKLENHYDTPRRTIASGPKKDRQ
ncbi:hypothetical protein [Spongorhabdus nitratireducens]